MNRVNSFAYFLLLAMCATAVNSLASDASIKTCLFNSLSALRSLGSAVTQSISASTEKKFAGIAVATGILFIAARAGYNRFQSSRKQKESSQKQKECSQIYEKYTQLNDDDENRVLQLSEALPADIEKIEETLEHYCLHETERNLLRFMLTQIVAAKPVIMEKAATIRAARFEKEAQELEHNIITQYQTELKYLEETTLTTEVLCDIVGEKFGSQQYRYLCYSDCLESYIKRAISYGKRLEKLAGFLEGLQNKANKLLCDFYQQEHDRYEHDKQEKQLVYAKIASENAQAKYYHDADQELWHLKNQLNSLSSKYWTLESELNNLRNRVNFSLK